MLRVSGSLFAFICWAPCISYNSTDNVKIYCNYFGSFHLLLRFNRKKEGKVSKQYFFSDKPPLNLEV